MSAGFRISIGTNVVLAVVVAVLFWRTQSRDTASGIAIPHGAPPVPTASTDASATAFEPKPGGPALTPAAVLELKRLGFSDDAIAEGLINDHTYRYDKRVRALQNKYAPKPVPRREMLAVAREGEDERIKELKAALGEDGYVAWDKEKVMGRINMGGVALDPELADKAYRLQKEFEEKDRAMRMAQEDGVTDGADVQELYNRAQAQLDSDLEKLLGKDRLTAMRGAPDAVAEVSRRFQDLNPSPAQAQAVLQAESDVHAREAALVQRLKENPAEAANLATELKALTDAREQNLRQIFGADNYDAAKVQNDSTYQKLSQYAEAWNLADTQIRPVYDSLSALHDEADRMRMAAEMSEAAGKPVNWHQVNAAIEQSKQQTEAALVNLIGGERVRRLQQNGLFDVR